MSDKSPQINQLNQNNMTQVIIKNIRILDVDKEDPSSPSMISIEDGRFHTINTEAGDAPANDAVVIDGEGLFALPGLIDCHCLLYTSPSPRDRTRSRMPSSA